jgi:hypothetical protein
LTILFSATDGVEFCTGGLCGAGRGVTVRAGPGVLLDSVEGRVDIEGVWRRRASMRSSSELRERLLRSETLGAGDVRAAVLSEPIRPPILLVPLKPGESFCRGTENVLDDPDPCEPIGAAIRPESGTLRAGVVTDGRDGLIVIDRPGLGDGLEGVVGVGRLKLLDGLDDGALGVGLLGLIDGRAADDR